MNFYFVSVAVGLLIFCCVLSNAQQAPAYKFDAFDWSPPATLNKNLKYDAEAVGSSIKCLAGPPPSFFCIMPSVKRDVPVIVRNRLVDRDQCYTCLATSADVDYKMLFPDVRRIDTLADYKNSSQLFIRLYNVTTFPTDTSFFDEFDDSLTSVVFTFSNGSEAVYNYIAQEARLSTITAKTATVYPTTQKFEQSGTKTSPQPDNNSGGGCVNLEKLVFAKVLLCLALVFIGTF